jgi:hypothetical protein
LRKTLVNIASIRSGVFLKPQAEGDVVYLQASYFDENGALQKELFPDIRWRDISEKHILKPGDVLFSAKGFRNFATVYEEKNLPAIASTSFLVISIWKNGIEPEYLAMILNSSRGQEYLKGMAKGTSIPAISKSQLEGFEIVIPPIEIQQKLVALNKLKTKESNLISTIERLKHLRFEMDLNRIIHRYE